MCTVNRNVSITNTDATYRPLSTNDTTDVISKNQKLKGAILKPFVLNSNFGKM